jgi:hypothetical protein
VKRRKFLESFFGKGLVIFHAPEAKKIGTLRHKKIPYHEKGGGL